MSDPVHYLKLAYLAETAILFNLAYIELKQKREVEKLAVKTAKLVSMSETTDFVRPKKCNRKSLFRRNIKCDRCYSGTKTDPQFDRFNLDYLSGVQKIVCEDPSKLLVQEPLNEIWSHAKCNIATKWFMKKFHLVVNNEYDRLFSSVLLIVATTILIGITILDNQIKLIPWNIWKIGVPWSTAFFLVLLATLLVPGLLWYMWRHFLSEYECLGLLLSRAFQNKSQDQANAGVADLIRE